MLASSVIVALAFATPSHSATLFLNAPDLGGNQGGDCVYNTICGPQFTGDTYAGQLFTLIDNSIINGFGFNSIVFNSVFGTSSNFRILSTNELGAPSELLTSGSSLLSNAPGPSGISFPTTNYSFSVAPLSLAAGNYVFAFQNVTSNFQDYLSFGEGTSGAFTSFDGGNTFETGYRQRNSVAISVFGDEAVAAAVPEPATWLMMILGFGMIGFGMRSAKRRSDEKFETKIKNITYGIA